MGRVERERGKDVEVGGDVVGLAVSSSEIDGVHILNSRRRVFFRPRLVSGDSGSSQTCSSYAFGPMMIS